MVCVGSWLIFLACDVKKAVVIFALSDVTMGYGNLLSVIGSPVQALKNGDDYRFLARNITRAIPVGVSVQNRSFVSSPSNFPILCGFFFPISDRF